MHDCRFIRTFVKEKKTKTRKYNRQMKLILLTTPDFFIQENTIINALFAEGLDILHILKPNSEPAYCERLLKLIDKQWHKKIVTHEHFYLKSEFKLRGIHLSPRNPAPPAKYRGHVSCSCYNMEDVERRKPKCDYVFLSQIFQGITRPDLEGSFSSDELYAAKKRGVIDSKVMAFGGISADRLDEIRDYGFGGVVIFGDIWKRFDYHLSSSYKGVINYFKLLRSKSE